MYEIETWENREKYGCLGFYLIKNDIYQNIPKSWNQKPKLITAKGIVVNVCYHYGFINTNKWKHLFKKSSMNYK